MEVFGVYIPTWLLLVLTIVLLIYVWLTWRHGELKDMGLPHPPPGAILGNVGMFLGKPGVYQTDSELYKKYGKIWGFYEGRIPTIVVADVDIIKQIMVRDFSNFVDRRRLVLRGIFKYGLFDATGDYWKHLRKLTSPAFSSGKVKYMSRLINQCTEQLKDSLHEKAAEGSTLDVKTITSAYTLDVIAATAFGLKLDSQKNTTSPFNANAKKILDLFQHPLILLTFFTPDLLKPLEKLGVTPFEGAPTQFFINIVKQTLQSRRESSKPNNQVDFLQLMMEAETLLDSADEESKQEMKDATLSAELNNKEKGLTEKEIIAQSLVFFLAGYETTATTMMFLMYLLAANPDLQDRALQEVQEVWPEKNEFKYEDLGKLKYLDMCIDETLRLYPPAGRVDRYARQEVTYKNLRIPKDFLVVVPIRVLHYDPEVWPEPEKFDPERFSPEAKAARNPYYYMPFGVGPRSCVGMRLAQMEIKLAMATVIKNFHLTVSSKCQEPLELDNTFLVSPKGGIWLNVEARK